MTEAQKHYLEAAIRFEEGAVIASSLAACYRVHAATPENAARAIAEVEAYRAYLKNPTNETRAALKIFHA